MSATSDVSLKGYCDRAGYSHAASPSTAATDPRMAEVASEIEELYMQGQPIEGGSVRIIKNYYADHLMKKYSINTHIISGLQPIPLTSDQFSKNHSQPFSILTAPDDTPMIQDHETARTPIVKDYDSRYPLGDKPKTFADKTVSLSPCGHTFNYQDFTQYVLGFSDTQLSQSFPCPGGYCGQLVRRITLF